MESEHGVLKILALGFLVHSVLDFLVSVEMRQYM